YHLTIIHFSNFFFQAEDGIRDRNVTGVQTCALPISTGPGVRLDSGVEEGDTISGQFDSMLAKLIVWGEDRDQALARAARALDEYVVEGMATVIPFHQHIVTNPAFVGDDKGFDVYTKWIETDWENPIEPWTPTGAPTDDDEPVERKKVVVEVDGRRVEVSLPG